MPKEEPEVIETEVNETEEKSHNKKSKKFHPSNTTLVLIVVSVSVIATLGIGAIVRYVEANNDSRFESQRITMMSTDKLPQIRMGQERMHNGYITSTNDSSSITQGVVISVSDSKFVIAGNGRQYTVNTTSDTTFNTSDKKVAVNDSVIIIGSVASDKTITATDVRTMNI